MPLIETQAREYVHKNLDFTDSNSCIRFNGNKRNEYRIPDKYPFIMLNQSGYLVAKNLEELKKMVVTIRKGQQTITVRSEIIFECYDKNVTPTMLPIVPIEKLQTLLDSLDSEDDFDAGSMEDAREFITTAIALRRGQRAFRNKLLNAYSWKCAVTSCDSLEALEAAHIIPYRGEKTNRVFNGLLLRADIHTLFDQKKLSIDSEYCVVLHPDLRKGHYRKLHRKEIEKPSEQGYWPSTRSCK